jgi:hypothetical protein
MPAANAPPTHTYIRYNIQYTTTPVRLTYSQIGNAQPGGVPATGHYPEHPGVFSAWQARWRAQLRM